MSFPNSNWANEAGEPYMTAAELRFEAELDAQSAEERFEESFYDYDEPDECEDCEQTDCICEFDDFDPMEDQWLDGSYEE